MQRTDGTDEEEYKSLQEELIEYYGKELAYIYTYHEKPPPEYYIPIQALLPQLILHLNGRQLGEVLADCWAIAWYREPLCHPDTTLY